jgi:hypothetical protein
MPLLLNRGERNQKAKKKIIDLDHNLFYKKNYVGLEA